MSRLSRIALITVAACFLMLLLAWVGTAAYARYSAAKERIAELEARVQELRGTAHPRWRVRVGTFSITTTDRPPTTNHTDFRLVYGTNAPQSFVDYIFKEPGHIVAAWVSDWTPRSEMSKFEQFTIWPSYDSSKFEVVAKARPGESVAMDFKMTFLVE
jgi:hypothetical protein